MTENKLEVISRRSVFSLFRLAIAGLTMPTALVTATDAEARVGQPLSP